MRILTFDFETDDPYIGRDLDGGWVYGINVPNHDFDVLGCAVRTHEGKLFYTTDWSELEALVKSHDALLAHNAQYDIGCLKYLGIHYEDKQILDTMIMSKLFWSSLMKHDLDSIAKKYLKLSKNDKALTDAIVKHDLYPYLKREINDKERAEKKGIPYERSRPDEAKLVKWAKSNMRAIQEADPEAMSQYAIADVDVCYRMYQYFIDNNISTELTHKYCNVIKILVDYRTRGIRVDLNKAREVDQMLTPLIEKRRQEMYALAGEEFNPASNKEWPPVFDKLGIKYPTTPAGNPSMTSKWLESQVHPVCNAIRELRRTSKIHNDFIKKVIALQTYTCPDAGDYGRVFPSLGLFNAITGRFSCSKPNMQQIPSHDIELAPLCRSIFVPEEGEQWFSLDYSNQEGRVQVHYAGKIGAEGAREIVDEFNKDPNLDLHQRVANMANVERQEAKILNLGISYGMGIGKIAASLGCSQKEAKELRDKYNKGAPYLDTLNNSCKRSMLNKGYIKTLGGRFLRLDPPVMVDGEKKSFEYKALNKLIQGSAADQTIEAMIWAYTEGIPVLLPIHDELVMSGTYEQAMRLKFIMENAVKLLVPTVVGIGEGGSNWSEGDH